MARGWAQQYREKIVLEDIQRRVEQMFRAVTEAVFLRLKHWKWQRAFGRFLHHTPAEAMRQIMKDPEDIKRRGDWRVSERTFILTRRVDPLCYLAWMRIWISPTALLQLGLHEATGSHPYGGSHRGFSGGSCGTSDSGGEHSGSSWSLSCGGGWAAEVEESKGNANERKSKLHE